MVEEKESTLNQEDVVVTEEGLTRGEAAEMSQTQLMVLRFRRNKLSMLGLIMLAIIYTLVAFGNFLGPNDPMSQNQNYLYGPPSQLSLRGPNGEFGLYTYEVSTELDIDTFKFVFAPGEKIPVRFFVRGDSYKLLGLFQTDLHLFGADAPNRIYLFGADALGRDMFTRVLIGGQISMTVGLLGVLLTIVLGSLFGAASGYWGGIVDDVMQRIIEVISCFPQIPLWAALAAALPKTSASFTMLHRYFLITVILSLVSWMGLARQLRGKVMAYSRADFTSAALIAGASDFRIILKHMLPNAASHIVVVAALAVPGMIMGETALSFLGLGLSRPMFSWGVLISEAQQIAVIIQHPWLMIPAVAVILAVFAFSVLGDGLRDAVDPYSI